MKSKSIVHQIYEVSTPKFTPAMGTRMKYMRMRLLLDQRELAEKLGVQQQIISKLERGAQPTTRLPFSIAEMQTIFGDTLLHILIGTGEDRFNYAYIANKYWTEKYKKRGFGTTGDKISAT